MHLYELSKQHQGLMALIEDGEMDAETLQDTLEGLEGDLTAKGQGTLAVLANLGHSIEAFNAEIKRMQARVKTLKANDTWLREYLRENMVATGITKIESPVFSASVGKPGKVVVIENEDKIPEPWRKVEMVEKVTVDKKQILADLKIGLKIPGCILGDAKAPLRIK